MKSVSREMEPVTIKALICAYAIKYQVDPGFATAVAHIESRKGNKEFRVGKMGKTYYGPMGIHKCFLNKWDIDKPEVNIEVGVRALRGVGNDKSLQMKRLKRYNASFNSAYWNQIKKAQMKYSGKISG